MNGQLPCALGLVASAVGAAAAGVPWVAVAAAVVAIPYFAIGVLVALGGIRARHDRTAH